MIMENSSNSNHLTTLPEENDSFLHHIQLSKEQKEFVARALEGNNVLVDACIGSGKTTAIQYLCDAFPEDKAILYLTYNRLLKVDAKSKIKNINVKVTNYHGFAYGVLKKQGIDANVGDLIQRFLKEKPEIPQYDILIIDEYQDINEEFADLLEYIKSTNPIMQIIAVGDMEQKIYDYTAFDISSFIKQFLGRHILLNFTLCFRLSENLAATLGRIWKKPIVGVNRNCTVEDMSIEDAIALMSKQNPKDILCLGHRTGDMADALNLLEANYADKFNKRTVWASIRDSGSTGSVDPRKNSAIFTTYDGSKGLERKFCFIFDFTEDYWALRVRISKTNYTTLRNIFCVAASRGKEHIIFVLSNKKDKLSENTLSTEFITGKQSEYIISDMFDFIYKEDVEECFSLLQINPVSKESTDVINIKRNDELIDLSPCIGIYQEATFFSEDNYNIDKEISLYLKKGTFSDKIKESNLDEKILYLSSLKTKQRRYFDQVKPPFVSDNEKAKIIERLSSVFTPYDNVQQECLIPFSDKEKGPLKFFARGLADVVKNDIVYELKFVSELAHEHFLQCACYMVALNLKKGILWNTRNNTCFEIFIPNVNSFLDAVTKAITKRSVTKYYKPAKVLLENYFAVIDIETNYEDKVMSIGIVISEENSMEVIDKNYYILTPEFKVGGIYSDFLKNRKVPHEKCTRSDAIASITSIFKEYGVSKIFAYSANYDRNHLPELSEYKWYDIMKIAAYKQYNPMLENLECFNTGRLKTNYGVEPIMRMLSNDHKYHEKHNAILDAIDELKIMQLLGHKLDFYDVAILQPNSSTSQKMKNKEKEEVFTTTQKVTHSSVRTASNTVSNYSTTDVYCSVEEAAKILNLSETTIRNLISENLLPAVTIKNKYKIKKLDLYAYSYKERTQRARAKERQISKYEEKLEIKKFKNIFSIIVMIVVVIITIIVLINFL